MKRLPPRHPAPPWLVRIRERKRIELTRRPLMVVDLAQADFARWREHAKPGEVFWVDRIGAEMIPCWP